MLHVLRFDPIHNTYAYAYTSFCIIPTKAQSHCIYLTDCECKFNCGRRGALIYSFIVLNIDYEKGYNKLFKSTDRMIISSNK